MFDALRMQFKGKPNKDTTLLKELGVVLGSVFMIPVIFIQHGIYKLFGKKDLTYLASN